MNMTASTGLQNCAVSVTRYNHWCLLMMCFSDSKLILGKAPNEIQSSLDLHGLCTPKTLSVYYKITITLYLYIKER